MERNALVGLLLRALAVWDSDPGSAADLLEEAAAGLGGIAAGLRARAGQTSVQGMGDRVRARVVGPDGQTVQTVDTRR